MTYKTGFCRAELPACPLGACTGEPRGLGSDPGPWPRESWGSCSRVSWSRRLVSWISKSIWGQGSVQVSVLRWQWSAGVKALLPALHPAPALDPCSPTSSSGTFRMGVPLISKIRSPTWMEFFTSGLMQPGSTLGINQWLDWFPSHWCPLIPIGNQKPR